MTQTKKRSLSLHADCLSTFSLAAQQNAYPLFRRLRLDFDLPVGEEQEKPPPFRNLTIKLTSRPAIFESEVWEIGEISAGQSITLQQRSLGISGNTLFELTEEVLVEITLSVFAEQEAEHVLEEITLSVAVLPANYWGGESRQPDLLAAFVKPNGVYVESLVRKVSQVLEQAGHGRSVDGYQSNTRDKPYLMVAALWNVIFSERIAYVSPPQGFAREGQRIRLAADISASKLGACLDTSLLFASCLELMGLNPVVALGKTHAFVGVWLIDERFPILANDDPMDLRKRIDSRDMVFFESTLVTNSQPVTFEEARAQGRELLSEDNEDEFVYVIDIKLARARHIKPLSSVEEKSEESVADGDQMLALPKIPPLPPVGADEQVIDETPETRIDAWQRKLLDLTKRNPLLALKDRAVALRLYCPDIGAMEDNLADGVSFKFLSSEESPLNDDTRSESAFRLQAGSDLHKEYALAQLEKSVLLANMSAPRLEKNSITLLRKAKNDLEEGGSNTLFLALGMLRWKENPDDDRSYKAPLILIPAELTRKSARAPIRVRQIPDESPIFNMTLIEFLFTVHSIDLNQFRDALPEDESGVDVQLVWSTVRAAIAEQPGFEVVEELILSSFSFAKYLMWKDLKDRIGDLKQNLFVEHLVDRPQEAYVQDSSFVKTTDVDAKIDPEKVFTPLNCDSSQLVAVEASGRSQDFVLEGPPGTGKSETIANILCHNIAQGRKVLFVAEKMAALHVVYRRMEKVGLDHLCLELHSNKANKKAVLEQLRRATAAREAAKSEGWLDSVKSLKDKRTHLNEFVHALHEKSKFGVSVREAIARDVFYQDSHSLKLDWQLGFESSPVGSQEDLKQMLQVSKMAAIAYNDVSDLDASRFSALVAKKWSFAWQTSVVECLTQYKAAIAELPSTANSLASTFGIDSDQNTVSTLKRVNSLVHLISAAEANPISYIAATGVRDLLANLESLRDKKSAYDECVIKIGSKVTPEIIAETPIRDWLVSFRESEDSWFRSFFAKHKINRSAKALGYGKLADLESLQLVEQAAELQTSISALSQPFEKDNIWRGWDTSAASLNEALTGGNAAYRALSDILGLTDEPAKVLTAVKSNLVDGRDFLESSKVNKQKIDFETQWKTYADVVDAAASLELVFDKAMSFDELNQTIDDLISSAAKFKHWSEWIEAKSNLENYHLNALAEALESRSILPEEAEAQVQTAFYRWLGPQMIDNSDRLREFKASSHEQLIIEFREIDADVAQTTGQYIAALAAEKAPDPFSKDSPTEFGVLAKELQKKTRHKPVRALFDEMGERLLDLCPCLMMSPLSVAQFLPSDFNAFDLVVFDEASQMTTWDSVGAIARGKNVIVVGDPKQMPPTNFFNTTIDADNPDEDDLESILDQALAARLPHLRLQGHYRSRHETLIAFSNSKYYENSLITYPAANTKSSAVTLHRIDGVYTKGKGRNNPIEAQAVADEIVRRLADPLSSQKSIGVVTLNTEQQRMIEDLLDEARRKHPEIEIYFQSTDSYDGVFVKNLESVQGDERDVIVISLGYGPTELHGRTMSMNFGPLNKAGGERRLNVAITRATTEVLVFSSFDSSMIDLSRSSALAVEHLKHYLEFAEKGPIALAAQSIAAHGIDQFDSEFEQSVALALRAKGWRVQTQIGVSKFRIDLGVIHPDSPGLYLAGVECDGATYHSSPSARDRDRVRHLVLENLGWRLIRLWSTEYFRDPEEAILNIESQLEIILAEDRQEQRAREEAHNDDREVVSQLETNASVLDNEDVSTQSVIEQLPGVLREYEQSHYFDPGHKSVLANIAKVILAEKNGITIHELALDIANLHGLARTSKKQINYLTDLITPWAGLKQDGVHKPVVWLTSADVTDEIPWRGLDAFGEDRDWADIPYPEVRGLARLALQQAPTSPVEFICDTFKIKRRHERTLEQFQGWIDDVGG